MTFSRKIFISVFLTTLVLGSALIWGAYRYVNRQATESYISRYTALSKVVGDTLNRLDLNTETLMLNAARVVEAKNAEKGLLSTDALKGMREDINATHIFILDQQGNFIRSTNEDPKLIPNAYSFCPAYRNMVVGTSQVEATPIIHPRPEPKPFKFVFIPSRDRKYLIEVGVRVDFIAKTLTETLKSDPNLSLLSLYAPDGTPFGRFSSEDIQFNGTKVNLPTALPYFVDEGDKFKFFSKVASSHPQCCQCDVSGVSRNGEYYYILETEVSKKELGVIQATTQKSFIFLAFGNILLAIAFSRFLSRRLVRNIEVAAKKVRQIKDSGDLKERIDLIGHDEVTFLTGEFNRLLDTLEKSQQKLIEAEKNQAKVQMAREVAHNIRSPAIAIEVILPMLGKLPEGLQKVLRDSAREIKALAEKLTREADKRILQKAAAGHDNSVSLLNIVKAVIDEKRIEYAGRPGLSIELSLGPQDDEILAFVDPVEFRAMISNLINNAIESYPAGAGKVEVSCFPQQFEARVVVKDYGKGMPQDVLQRIGAGEAVSTKSNGSGIGLCHALRKIAEWHGNVDIRSNPNYGTTLTVTLPLALYRDLDISQKPSMQAEELHPKANDIVG